MNHHHSAECQPVALPSIIATAASKAFEIEAARARARAADRAVAEAFTAFKAACHEMEVAIRELRMAAAGSEQGGVQ